MQPNFSSFYRFFKKILLSFLVLCLLLTLFAMQKPVLAKSTTLSVSAESCVLMEAESGTILYQKNADSVRGMASTTKIMTAYVAITKCPDLQMEVSIDPCAVGVEGTSAYLKAGETLTLQDLLYAVLLSSANDASVALACAVSQTVPAFVASMNEQAAAWGLTNTHFENPHGLDAPTHKTTAKELATLTKYALQNETFAKIVATERYSCQSKEGYRHTFVNHNRLLHRYAGAVGVKTGFTKKCGRCLVSSAVRDGVQLIAVTLQAPNDWQDHANLFDYGFSRYERRQIVKEGEFHIPIPVVGSTVSQITATNLEPLFATVKKDSVGFALSLEAPLFCFAPVEQGEVVAVAHLQLEDGRTLSVPLYATESATLAPKPSRLWRIKQFFKQLF